MTSGEFRAALLARARNAGLSIPSDAEDQLEAYFQLLAQWNARINLTSLPLQRPTDQTFDRLLIEPLVAARDMADSARAWFDIGSGGGSPAIPLKIVHPRANLTMIESKTRKAAFLREAVRLLGLTDVQVKTDRFEAVAEGTEAGAVDLVTMRAVKRDRSIFDGIQHVLSPHGRVFWFHSVATALNPPPPFAIVKTERIGTSATARLSILQCVFHVERSR